MQAQRAGSTMQFIKSRHFISKLTAASLKGPDVVLVDSSVHGPVVGKHQNSTDAALAGLVQNKVQTHQNLLIIHTYTTTAFQRFALRLNTGM